VRLSDKAYHLIRQRIITLELPPLSPIDEQALMEELRLGRTPIREALQRLATEDLILLAPRRGMFVADISITDLQKVFELRMTLEGLCAHLAAERASAEQLQAMRQVVRDLDGVPDDDDRGLMVIDERFHELVYEAADNKFLADVLLRLHAHSFRIWHMVLERIGSVRGALEQHIAITEAIEARDPEQAERLVRQHVADFQEKIKAAL
jgi:DNA-binding GntR family transcriptional regulator